MTHKDIYTKFMIEYDKANVTSSYPSLTEYEVATVLDKAYNALIAQKVTGNNVRRSTFESDIKSIADLSPLTKTEKQFLTKAALVASNVVSTPTPNDMLYFLQANMLYRLPQPTESGYLKYENEYAAPLDGEIVRKLPIKLVNHEIAQKFFSSAFNMPWIKEPVCYIEDNYIYVVYDSLDTPEVPAVAQIGSTLNPDSPKIINTPTEKYIDLTYIKTPNKFAKDVDDLKAKYNPSTITYFDYEGGNEGIADLYEFECNDTVAEELISLAIAFALENVESSRLNAKLNMRGLEA